MNTVDTVDTVDKDENHIWLNNPMILVNREFLFELWPKVEYTLEENINAITRTILFATIFGLIFIRHKPLKLIVTSVVCVVVVVLYYKHTKEKLQDDKGKNTEEFSVLDHDDIDYNEDKKRKLFQEPSKENPYGNVLPLDVKDNPLRKPAPPAYNKDVDREIKNAVKDNLNKKLFRDLGDNISFDESQRQFLTMPITTVPNNQRGFAEFCYGNLASDKENGIERM